MRRNFKCENWLFVVILLMILSCNKGEPTPSPGPSPGPPPPPVILSADKEITYFGFKAANNPVMSADINGSIGQDTIQLLVPATIPLNNLIPTITIKGKSVNPQTGVAQDFNNLVLYTVTAEDGTTRKYIVTVIVIHQSPEATVFFNSYNASPNTLPGNKGYLYAIDPSTGSLQWKYEPSVNGFYGSPTISNGIVYTANKDKVIAIDIATRSLKWEYKAGAIIQSSLLLLNQTIYTNCNDGSVYALNAATGGLKWKFIHDSTGNASCQSSPTVADGAVYFASGPPYMYAVDINNSSLKWKKPSSLFGGNEIFSNPSVVNGLVYFGDLYGNILALNANDGTTKWSFKVEGIIIGSPTVLNGVVYIGDSYNLYAMDALTGALKWKFPVASGVGGSPVISRGIVFFAGKVGSESQLYAVDIATGVQKWKYSYGVAADVISPVVFNDAVYFAIGGDLVALDVDSGKLKWVFHAVSTKESSFGPPCVVDDKGNVYYSSESGHQQ